MKVATVACWLACDVVLWRYKVPGQYAALIYALSAFIIVFQLVELLRSWRHRREAEAVRQIEFILRSSFANEHAFKPRSEPGSSAQTERD